jgi:hypothetical protein
MGRTVIIWTELEVPSCSLRAEAVCLETSGTGVESESRDGVETYDAKSVNVARIALAVALPFVLVGVVSLVIASVNSRSGSSTDSTSSHGSQDTRSVSRSEAWASSCLRTTRSRTSHTRGLTLPSSVLGSQFWHWRSPWSQGSPLEPPDRAATGNNVGHVGSGHILDLCLG